MIPVPKANELIDELILLVDKRSPDQLSLARIEREGRQLLQSRVTPELAHMVLGTAAALKFDIDGFRDHFRIAQQNSSSPTIRTNFAVMALRLGLLKDAYGIVASLMGSYPDNLTTLGVAREVALAALQFDKMYEIQERLTRLQAKQETGYIEISRLSESTERAKRMGIQGDAILDRLEVASSILREAREPVFSRLFDIGLDGRFSYSLGVKCDVDTLCDLNFRIVDRMIESFDDTYSDLFTIGCLVHRGDVPTSRLSDPRSEAQ